MGRMQTQTLTVRLTPEEKKALEARKKKASALTTRAFVLEMCMEGKIIVNEDLRATNAELRRQGNNLNQLTRLAHQGRIEVVELTELLECYHRILRALGGSDNGGG